MSTTILLFSDPFVNMPAGVFAGLLQVFTKRDFFIVPRRVTCYNTSVETCEKRKKRKRGASMAGGSEKFILPSEERVSLSAAAVDQLIQTADPSAALLYLYILRHRGEITAGQAAKDLRMTEGEVGAALRTLDKLGLVRQNAPRAHYQEDKLPNYTIQDIARENRDGTFRTLLQSVQEALGTKLSSSDVEKLIGIRRELGFPPEVILLLVNYCVSETTRKYGPGRRPTMRFVEKTAFTWEREEIVTLEQAETYIRRREERRSAMEQIKRALQIRDRELSPTERQYVDSWIEKGFTPDAVEIAYDRTIIKTERRAWPYMNSILNAWHDKGLHTAEEILSAEQPAGPKSGTPGAYAQAGSADAERDHMRRLLRELNKE